jgi:hypothetical protein|tara:strand:+ start:299 stop:484 length:186 start_codon:yes stop_codon:yes gene_type:complete
MSKKNDVSYFDKFMKDIVKREDAAVNRSKNMSEQTSNSPQREYNKLYRERWQNRITWGNKK